MKFPTVGGCLCRAVRYEITEPPKLNGLCHCRSCQYSTGSSYFPFLAVLTTALDVSGEITWYESIGFSGNKINRGFCTKCGSTLFGKPGVLPHIITVSASSLDDPSEYKPEMSVWVEDAQSWCLSNSELKKFDQNPF